LEQACRFGIAIPFKGVDVVRDPDVVGKPIGKAIWRADEFVKNARIRFEEKLKLVFFFH
jgi:hypothetical protein